MFRLTLVIALLCVNLLQAQTKKPAAAQKGKPKEDTTQVKKDPEPFVALGELGASVMITVRAWAKTDDYWNVYFALNKRIYEDFEKEGLHLTSPQEHVVQMQTAN